MLDFDPEWIHGDEIAVGARQNSYDEGYEAGLEQQAKEIAVAKEEWAAEIVEIQESLAGLLNIVNRLW